MTRATIVTLSPLVVIGFCLGACAAIDNMLGGPAPPYQHDPWAQDHHDAVPLYEKRLDASE